MKNKTIILAIGTRPSFIMASEIIKNFKKKYNKNFIVIHSGQHYSKNMNKIFFDELNIPKPDKIIKYRKRRDSKVCNIANIMTRFEKIINYFNPAHVIVLGDTDTNLACAITARKNNIHLIHIESGQRSRDLSSPEEQNRIMIDHISDRLFVTNAYSKKNLLKEGIKKNITILPHPICEVIKKNVIRKEKKIKNKKKKIIITMHRQENMNKEKIILFLDVVNRFCFKNKILSSFYMHPRLQESIKNYNIKLSNFKNIKFFNPISFKEMLAQISDARLVITDSGGIQQESYILKVNCLTLLSKTPWPETLNNNCNQICNFKKNKLMLKISAQYFNKRVFKKNIFGNDECSNLLIRNIEKL